MKNAWNQWYISHIFNTQVAHLPSLIPALNLTRETCAAIVGAGGKTTLLFSLARAFSPPVWLTTTTHLAAEQCRWADRHIIITGPEQTVDVDGYADGLILFSGPLTRNERVASTPEDFILRLAETAALNRIPLLIEADGARRLLLKAPKDHEPPIPGFVNTVMVVASLSALGKPLTEETVYNPAGFAQLTHLPENAPIAPQHIVDVLLHPFGGLKKIPARVTPQAVLTPAVSSAEFTPGRAIARQLLPTYQAVHLAHLQPGPTLLCGRTEISESWRPTAGIILAAGAASRFGAPKLLQTWQGKPILHHVIETALQASLSPLLLVVGAYADQIQQAALGYPVQIVHNPDWASGQAASIRTAVQVLPAHAAAAVFLLGDQPRTPVELIDLLRQEYAASPHPILIPEAQGRSGNPTLFDHSTFAALTALTGDSGGRQLFSRFPPRKIPWPDPLVFQDIDTPDDYAQLIASPSSEN